MASDAASFPLPAVSSKRLALRSSRCGRSAFVWPLPIMPRAGKAQQRAGIPGPGQEANHTQLRLGIERRVPQRG